MRTTMASWLLIVGLALSPQADAAPPTKVQIEVNFLLGYLEGSGCEFYRNGSWHDSNAAQEHLRDKYNYLVAKDQVNSTEAFIDSAATQSSLSGEAYAVKCAGAATMSSNQWLRDELARFRKF